MKVNNSNIVSAIVIMNAKIIDTAENQRETSEKVFQEKDFGSCPKLPLLDLSQELPLTQPVSHPKRPIAQQTRKGAAHTFDSWAYRLTFVYARH
jgi:hypothetical protein